MYQEWSCATMHTDLLQPPPAPQQPDDCNCLSSPGSDPSLSSGSTSNGSNEPHESASVDAPNECSSSSFASSSNENSPCSTIESPEVSEVTQHLNDLNLTTPTVNEEEVIAEELYDNILDQIILGVYFEVLRSNQSRRSQARFANEVTTNVATLNLKSEPQNSKGSNKISDNTKTKTTKSNGDIFGHSLNGIRKLECTCPNCSRNLAASRLAPHLEKCMGMGRNSSRLASKRIALFIKNSNGASSE